MSRPLPLLPALAGAAAGSLLVGIAASLAQGEVKPKGDRDLGQYLSAECVTCHQASGLSDGIPPIVGWPEEVFVAVMGEYKSNRRENPVMRTLAARLGDEEIAALAAYFRSLPERSAKP